VEVIDDTPDGLVLDGVPAGARIIISGQDLVSDGEVVLAVAAASIDAGAAPPADAAGESGSGNP
jgi:multidrug efflux system membrane fusion protein